MDFHFTVLIDLWQMAMPLFINPILTISQSSECLPNYDGCWCWCFPVTFRACPLSTCVLGCQLSCPRSWPTLMPSMHTPLPPLLFPLVTVFLLQILGYVCDSFLLRFARLLDSAYCDESTIQSYPIPWNLNCALLHTMISSRHCLLKCSTIKATA
jgi:hypothetical protein